MQPAILYGVNDRPPLLASLLLGLQHVSIYCISLTIPLLIVSHVDGPEADAAFLVSMCLLGGGIGSMLQALRRGPVGSGYLCPQVCGPSFLSASTMAYASGGLALLAGMTVLAGSAESLFSRVVNRLRVLFPAEVLGLIVAMVGITVVHMAGESFLGMDHGETAIDLPEMAVAVWTLALMVGLNVYSKGRLKLFCALLGMLVGYATAYFAGMLPMDQIHAHLDAPWFALPLAHHEGFGFNVHMVLPFIIAMLCSSLKSVGDLTLCQKINDPEWSRPDMGSIRKGILADGLGCVVAGLLGGMGQSTSSSNVGLSLATGATSRFIAFSMGGIMILLSFCPKLAVIFAFLPRPVIGAVLLFALSFMIVAGIQIIMTRMLDARKTFVVGLSMIFGLMVDMMPQAFEGLPEALAAVFSSSLSTATISAVVLNLIFRIGIRRSVSEAILPGDAPAKVFSFLEHAGKTWGANRRTVNRAAAAISEFLEAMEGTEEGRRTVDLVASYDEFSIRMELRYTGDPVHLPEQPPIMEDLGGEATIGSQFAGHMVRYYSGRVKEDLDGTDNLLVLTFEA